MRGGGRMSDSPVSVPYRLTSWLASRGQGDQALSSWVRATRRDGTTYVEAAGLDRSNGADPERGAAEIDDLVATLKERP